MYLTNKYIRFDIKKYLYVIYRIFKRTNFVHKEVAQLSFILLSIMVNWLIIWFVLVIITNQIVLIVKQ